MFVGKKEVVGSIQQQGISARAQTLGRCFAPLPIVKYKIS